MADSRALVGRVVEANTILVDAMDSIREIKAQVDSNPQILDDPEWSNTYPSFTKQEILDALAAWGQLTFSYDSGNPTQKSKIYKIL